ncbi:Uncharacterized protein conserved in bacteria [Chromobacterium violaceum]|uniref:Uncharacterized protein conserved in bacteria n=1 Tax=Chromobacterium violaceum TaxID=536 RepID=A0A3S4JSH5_CHRVL|nr:Uncharacterized protein conserved in bacteria [Chromobacterium violaceum]
MPLPAALFDEMLDHARALPGAEFDVKWGGTRVVSIGGKMFLVCGEAGISYKVADDDFLALSGLPGVRPAPYLAAPAGCRWFRWRRWRRTTSAAASSARASLCLASCRRRNGRPGPDPAGTGPARPVHRPIPLPLESR